MRFLTVPLVCLFVASMFMSCQKEVGGKDSLSSMDPDAKKFIEVAQLTDTVTKNGINHFVKELKKASLWNKFSAIYPVVGGTAESVKWNLKDPRDLDEAFRLTLHGNPNIAETGILFPTIDDYADTHLTDSMMTYNSNSISYYSRTQNTVSGYDMGCHDNYAPYTQMTIFYKINATDYFGFYRFGYMPDNTKGLFMLSATENNVAWFENGVKTYEKGSAPVAGFTGYPMLIGWCQNALSGGQRECGLATIGKGLTDSEAETFNNIVKDFQTRLGRQVF